MSARPKGTVPIERRCIFCGGKGLTREHLWSEWISRQFSKSAHDTRHETDQTFTNTMAPVTNLDVKARHGHATTKKLKVVCRTCNNGWMSGLDDAVKPILQPLMNGQPEVLTPVDQQILSQWITMKVFVSEHGWPSPPIATPEVLRRFYEDRTIPDWTTIFLFRSVGGAWESQYHRHSAGLAMEQVPFDRSVRNLHTVTFGIGRLVIYVLQGYLVELEMGFDEAIARKLYPLAGAELDWPPSLSVNDDAIEAIAGNLASFVENTTSVIGQPK